MPKPSVCIKVPKTSGEKTITLVNKVWACRQITGYSTRRRSLCIPLIREPQGIELTTLKSQIPNFSLLTAVFSEKQLPPETLTQALQDKLPPDLLANVPQAFDIIGDIVVIDIPPQLKPYQNINRRSNPANTKKRHNCPCQSKRHKRRLPRPRLRLHRWGTQNQNHPP